MHQLGMAVCRPRVHGIGALSETDIYYIGRVIGAPLWMEGGSRDPGFNYAGCVFGHPFAAVRVNAASLTEVKQ